MKILELALSRKLLTAGEPVTGLTSPAVQDPRGSCGEVGIVQPNPHIFINKKNMLPKKSFSALRFEVQGDKIKANTILNISA